VILEFSLVNTTPLLKDLYENITPHHAAKWRVIGARLDLPIGTLNNIEARWPTNVEECCNRMLEKWVEVDTKASWKKMCEVIESPAVSSNGKKVYCILHNMETSYITT